MTYPPQPGQPGQPDPYGQQPGPYGANPWGQQPPQQPPQQQPPQPGYPGSGPMPQQQPPGAYPAGQQYGPQYGQQYGPQYGQPGFGGAPGGPPPKKKTGLIVGLSIAAVALIGGALALYFFVFASDDEDELNELADNIVTALSEQDVNLAKKIVCDPSQVTEPTNAPQFEVSRNGEVKIDGDTAEIPLKIEGNGKTDEQTVSAAKKDGSWCFDNSSGS